MNGLIEDPARRWPRVARLEGLGVRSSGRRHRLDPGVVVVEDDHRCGRRRVAQVAVDRFFRRALQAHVERRLDLQPAEERFRGAVAVDKLLPQPRGEVGRLRVEAWGARCRRGREGPGSLTFLELLFGDVALFVHLFEHEVAPSEVVFGEVLGVVGRRRGDDRRPGSPPPTARAPTRRARSRPRSPGGRRRSRSARRPRSPHAPSPK